MKNILFLFLFLTFFSSISAVWICFDQNGKLYESFKPCPTDQELEQERIKSNEACSVLESCQHEDAFSNQVLDSFSLYHQAEEERKEFTNLIMNELKECSCDDSITREDFLKSYNVPLHHMQTSYQIELQQQETEVITDCDYDDYVTVCHTDDGSWYPSLNGYCPSTAEKPQEYCSTDDYCSMGTCVACDAQTGICQDLSIKTKPRGCDPSISSCDPSIAYNDYCDSDSDLCIHPEYSCTDPDICNPGSIRTPEPKTESKIFGFISGRGKFWFTVVLNVLALTDGHPISFVIWQAFFIIHGPFIDLFATLITIVSFAYLYHLLPQPTLLAWTTYVRPEPLNFVIVAIYIAWFVYCKVFRPFTESTTESQQEEDQPPPDDSKKTSHHKEDKEDNPRPELEQAVEEQPKLVKQCS